MMKTSVEIQAEIQAIVDKQGKPIEAVKLVDGSTVFQDGSVLQQARVESAAPVREDGLLKLSIMVSYESTEGIARLFALYHTAVHRERGAIETTIPMGTWDEEPREISMDDPMRGGRF